TPCAAAQLGATAGYVGPAFIRASDCHCAPCSKHSGTWTYPAACQPRAVPAGAFTAFRRTTRRSAWISLRPPPPYRREALGRALDVLGPNWLQFAATAFLPCSGARPRRHPRGAGAEIRVSGAVSRDTRQISALLGCSLAIAGHARIPVGEGPVRVVLPGPHVHLIERWQRISIGLWNEVGEMAVHRRGDARAVPSCPFAREDEVLDAHETEGPRCTRLVDQHFRLLGLEHAVV